MADPRGLGRGQGTLRAGLDLGVALEAEHGPPEPIRLRVAIEDDGTVHGEVEDRGTGQIAPRDQGLGLWIVDALADSWAPREHAGPVRFKLSGPR